MQAAEVIMDHGKKKFKVKRRELCPRCCTPMPYVEVPKSMKNWTLSTGVWVCEYCPVFFHDGNIKTFSEEDLDAEFLARENSKNEEKKRLYGAIGSLFYRQKKGEG